MELLDKSTVVAEIERRIKERDIQMKQGCWVSSTYMYEDLLDFLDTIETKVVDLEKEYEEFVVDDHILGNFITNDTMGMVLAKHFFELGLKTRKGGRE